MYNCTLIGRAPAGRTARECTIIVCNGFLGILFYSTILFVPVLVRFDISLSISISSSRYLVYLSRHLRYVEVVSVQELLVAPVSLVGVLLIP